MENPYAQVGHRAHLIAEMAEVTGEEVYIRRKSWAFLLD